MNNDVFSFQNNQNLNSTNSTLEINLTKDQIKKLYEQVKYVNNSINKIEKILDLRLPEILKPSVQYNQTMLVDLEVLKLIIENSLNLKYN